MAPTVRPALPSDAERLAAIDRATWTSGGSPAPLPPADRPFFDDRTRPEDVLVAESDGAVVGYAQLGDSLPIPAHRHVLELRGLAVHPDAARRGAGRALVDAAVAEAGRRGHSRMTLRVLGPNTAARRLYEAAGFVVEGVLRGEFVVDGQPVDDVLMARRLP